MARRDKQRLPLDADSGDLLFNVNRNVEVNLTVPSISGHVNSSSAIGSNGEITPASLYSRINRRSTR